MSRTRKQTEILYELTAENTVGCYYTDKDGNPWCTFTCLGNGTHTCEVCGASISGGYSRGKLGDESFFCAKHVHCTYPDYSTEEKLVRQLIESIRERCFDNTYGQASDEECLGLAISHFFGVNQQAILQTCYNAVEDANHHKAEDALRPLIHAYYVDRERSLQAS